MSRIPRFISMMLGASDTVKSLAQEGDLGKFKDYLKNFGAQMPDIIHTEIEEFLEELLENPQSLTEKDALLQAILDNGYDFSKFFTENEDAEAKIWTLYARDPGARTARAGAMLLTELVKDRFVKTNNPFSADFSFVPADDKSLTTQDEIRKMKESILLVQNCMVDYVAKEGAELPINRAPAFLYFMRDQEQAGFWNNKISDLAPKSVYSTTDGDIFKGYTPVFS